MLFICHTASGQHPVELLTLVGFDQDEMPQLCMLFANVASYYDQICAGKPSIANLLCHLCHLHQPLHALSDHHIAALVWS